VTVVVAAALVAGVLGVGFLVQRVALREPSVAQLRGLHAADWLQHHRLVASAFSVDGGPARRGQCLQDWLTVGAHRRRGAVLRLEDGFVLVAAPPHTLVASGGTAAEQSLSPLVLLELGGCPRLLARRLGTVAQQHGDLVLSSRPREDTLTFALQGTRVTLVLRRGTSVPVGVEVAARSGMRGMSRIRFLRLTPELRRRFPRRVPANAR
jgi:hypothetical protein